MNAKVVGHKSLLIALVLLGLFFSVVDLDAQTRRRRTRRSVPVVSPTPIRTEPLIISRAEDFPDPDAPAVQPVPDERVNTAGDIVAPTFDDLLNRIKSLEAGRKKDNDAVQKRLLLNLDILTRAEQRAETMRRQLFEMIEKESAINTKLELLESDLRPEAIERSVAFAGSLRPEELRNMRRKNLEIEQTNLRNLLADIQKTKASLEQNVQKADILVDKLRIKLEKEIDDALIDEPQND